LDHLCQSNGTNPCAHWVQLGTYQGYLPHINSPSASHIYLEDNWDGCTSGEFDMGTLANANQAYYINYDGFSDIGGCGGREYEFAYRKISWASSPIYYGVQPFAHGLAIVNTELHSNTSTVPEGNEYFGTNDLHQANAGYAIHVQNSSGGTWFQWSSSQVVTPGGGQNPPYFHNLVTPWAFYTGAY
jgi:hypothetical protein